MTLTVRNGGCLVAFLGGALFLSGCMTIPGKTLPARTTPIPSVCATKPAIEFSYETFSVDAERYAPSVPESNVRIEKLLRASDLFSGVRYGTGTSSWQIAFWRQDDVEEGTVACVVVFGLCSAFTIPTCQITDYTLVAEVRRNGRRIKSYHCAESQYQWFHLFLLPYAMAVNPVREEREVAAGITDKMILQVLTEIDKDKVLDTP